MAKLCHKHKIVNKSEHDNRQLLRSTVCHQIFLYKTVDLNNCLIIITSRNPCHARVLIYVINVCEISHYNVAVMVIVVCM